jgi:hypothetical protein
LLIAPWELKANLNLISYLALEDCSKFAEPMKLLFYRFQQTIYLSTPFQECFHPPRFIRLIRKNQNRPAFFVFSFCPSRTAPQRPSRRRRRRPRVLRVARASSRQDGASEARKERARRARWRDRGRRRRQIV